MTENKNLQQNGCRIDVINIGKSVQGCSRTVLLILTDVYVYEAPSMEYRGERRIDAPGRGVVLKRRLYKGVRLQSYSIGYCIYTIILYVYSVYV